LRHLGENAVARAEELGAAMGEDRDLIDRGGAPGSR